MKTTTIVWCIALSVLTSTTDISAAVEAGPAPSAREAQLQAEIQKLEKRLETANQIISEQKAELDVVRNGGALTTTATIGSNSTTVPVLPADNDLIGTDSATKTHNYREFDSSVNLASPYSPTSITRLSEKTLSLGGVEDLSRVEFLAPGLRYGQSGHDVRFSMRGARTNSIGPEATGVVAVYEDGIYIPTSTEQLDAFTDVQRVEVLRGPQITTFGQHAYAGAINIVSNRPDFEGFYGYAEAENGLPDKTRWKLSMNIPATDTLSFRLAGVSESRSGWISNNVIESDSDDLNDRKVQTMRASVLWQPNDDFSLLVRSRYHDENGTGSAPWGYQQIGAYIDGGLVPGHQFAPEGYRPDNSPWLVYRNFISAAEYEHWVNTIELDWDMGFADLKWLSNYTSFHGRQHYDNDYSDKGENISSAFAGWDNSQLAWSSELRLSSNNSGPLSWLLGLYFFDQQTEWGWLEALNGVVSQPDWDVTGTYKADTTAVFGQASYALGDRFTLTAGLRWNEDGKTLKSGENGTWSDVLWKAALQYDFNDTSMAFVSASTGYRAGGINTAPGVNPYWDPEKLTAYEIGLKTKLANGQVNLNLSAWYNDFTDVQSQSFLVQPYPGSPEATEYTGNGGALNASGVEAEIQWLPTPSWNISTHIAYTSAKFGDYQATNLAGLGDIPGHSNGDSLSLKGWRPALSPEWVIGLQTAYDFNLKEWGTMTPYLQTTYSSSYYVNDLNLAGLKQSSQSRTDVRLIWQTPADSFRIQLYYLNAEDKATLNWARAYNPAARPEITTLQANWNNPNTYGIIFDYTF